jgi:hypothetical protein
MNKHWPRLSASMAASEALNPVSLPKRRYDYTLLQELSAAARMLDVAALRAGATPGFPDSLTQSRLEGVEDAVERAIAKMREALNDVH